MTRQHVIHDRRTDPHPQTPRRETARALKRSGKTYAEIGEVMGISRQRAQQLVRPATKEHAAIVKTANGVCQKCGKSARKLEAHHDDYDNAPSQLLCTSCHKKADHLQTPQYSKVRSKSGFKGVYFQRGKWQAQICVNNKLIYLGLFPDPVSAARARDAASLKYFGQFARLNFPQEQPA